MSGHIHLGFDLLLYFYHLVINGVYVLQGRGWHLQFNKSTFFLFCILQLLYYFVKGKIKMLVFLLISGLSGESTFGKLAGIGMVGQRKNNNPEKIVHIRSCMYVHNIRDEKKRV